MALGDAGTNFAIRVDRLLGKELLRRCTDIRAALDRSNEQVDWANSIEYFRAMLASVIAINNDQT
jgi:hypothetical protein